MRLIRTGNKNQQTNTTMNQPLPATASPIQPVLAALLMTLLALTFAGCGASKPNSASFASVVIKGHTPEEIWKATVEVFQEAGYAAGSIGDQIVFQKEGSRMTNLAYEGLVGAHYGAQTLVRVKANLFNLGEGAYRLQCQAFVVKDAGDQFFQEEQRLANVRSGPYQSLLDKVAKRFK
jgi:hypothetical protein